MLFLQVNAGVEAANESNAFSFFTMHHANAGNVLSNFITCTSRKWVFNVLYLKRYIYVYIKREKRDEREKEREREESYLTS